ncbi:tyrosine-type recombinase/integrase [Clostridium sp. DL1XJH146]
MDKLIIDFLHSLEKRNLAENTISAYKRDIVKFDDYLKANDINFRDVEKYTVMAYVQHLRKLSKANSTIIRLLVTLRSYYKYLIKKKIIIQNPFDEYVTPKNTRNIPQILTIGEIDEFLNMPDTSQVKGIRDKAVLELMYATGIKTSELLNLNESDINFEYGYINCKNAKKERILPIGPHAIYCLRDYIIAREEINKYNKEILFLNLKGNNITRQGLWKIIKEYSDKTGIDKKIDSNILRHSFAVHLLQNGADIKTIQELLGHSVLTSTLIYSNISKENKIMEVYKKAHPRY